MATTGAAPAFVPVIALPALMPPRAASIGVEAAMLSAGLVRGRLAAAAIALSESRPEDPVPAAFITAATGSLIPSVSPITIVPIGKNKPAISTRHGHIGSSRSHPEKAAGKQCK
jgi:hypothetical protein